MQDGGDFLAEVTFQGTPAADDGLAARNPLTLNAVTLLAGGVSQEMVGPTGRHAIEGAPPDAILGVPVGEGHP
eukprot:7810103-Lingulodinium_polyedra.AAC.1